MAKTSGSILQAIRSMVEDQGMKELRDRELLRRFVGGHDEAAFHTLLRRHGPLVLDVCRSLLANQADAEDAFQATFLVFARKAKGIREATSLSSWLYGVAYRIALKARAEFAKRKKHESLVPTREFVESADDLTWRDVKAVIHRELNSLPERYRATLVLCYLEGRTQDEVAQQLQLPKGTLKGRLERGRALLRERLVHRGLGPAAMLVAAAWSASDLAALPPALLGSTARAAARLVAGRVVSGFVSAKVVTLAEGVVNAMFITRLKIATVFLLVLGVFGTGAGAFIHSTLAAEQKDAKGPSEQTTGSWDQEPPPAQAKVSPPQNSVAPDADQAAAEWVVDNGGIVQTAARGFKKGQPFGDGPFKITGISLDSNENVKDEDLARFKDLTKLNNLSLSKTPIDDAGLKHLAGLKSLESLYLWQTKVGDAGLAHLKGMAGLVNLYLDETKVTDAGLEHLTGMTRLRILYLRHTQITDAGLKHLKAMPRLCWVDLWGTKVTDAGVKGLQTALPSCTITNGNPKNDRPTPPAKADQPADARAAAIAAIKQLGGKVEYEPRLFVIGNDDPKEKLAVSLRDRKIKDADLKHLKELTELAHLELRGTPV